MMRESGNGWQRKVRVARLNSPGALRRKRHWGHSVKRMVFDRVPARSEHQGVASKPDTGRNARAVPISPGGSGAVLDGLELFEATGHSVNEVGFLMLSKIALAEPEVELFERQGSRRPFERMIEPVPEIAINKQLLAEQRHQVGDRPSIGGFQFQPPD